MSAEKFLQENEPGELNIGKREFTKEQLVWYLENYAANQVSYPKRKFELDLKKIIDIGNTEATAFNNGERSRYQSIIRMRNIAKNILSSLT